MSARQRCLFELWNFVWESFNIAVQFGKVSRVLRGSKKK
jgi:hypothetical protein